MEFLMQYIMGWHLAAALCLVLGLSLLIFEMFTPGLGVPGLLGLVLIIAAVVLRADTFANGAVTLAIIFIVIGIAGFFIYRSFKRGLISRSPIVLKERIEETSTPLMGEKMQQLVGREGTALSALRPSGTIAVGEQRLDVMTEGEFVMKGARVRIVRVEGLRVLVKPIEA